MNLPPEFWDFAKASPVAAVLLLFGCAVWWNAKKIWAAIGGLATRILDALIEDKAKDRQQFIARQKVLERHADATLLSARGTIRLARAVEKASGNGNGIHVITEKVMAGKKDTDDEIKTREFEDEIDEDPEETGREAMKRKR